MLASPDYRDREHAECSALYRQFADEAPQPDHHMKQPHIFAGNPLDRGDVQRRDEAQLADLFVDPETLVLPMWQLNVLVHSQPTCIARLDQPGRRRTAGH